MLPGGVVIKLSGPSLDRGKEDPACGTGSATAPPDQVEHTLALVAVSDIDGCRGWDERLLLSLIHI